MLKTTAAVVFLATAFALAQAPASRPATPPANPAQNPELLALLKEIEPKRADALQLAKTVTKDQIPQAQKNFNELKALTEKLNALVAPLAATSSVRYGPNSAVPRTGPLKAIYLYKAARAIEQYNLAHKSEMTDDEYGVFVETNIYREALGLIPFEYDLRLRDSARGHSNWMSETGTFEHESDLPGKKTFAQRIKSEGYNWNACAENIAEGHENAKIVFQGWFDSPGHHHNLVEDFTHLGVGRKDKYWTQNFAKGHPPKASSTK